MKNIAKNILRTNWNSFDILLRIFAIFMIIVTQITLLLDEKDENSGNTWINYL